MSPNEKMVVPDEYCSYEKFIWTLLNEARQHKLKTKVIGYEKCKRTGINYPLYRFVIRPEGQQTVCLVAGVHGNEIAGPLSSLHIITDIIHELPENYRYVIYPLINPSGFDLRQRFDSDGRDLNADYSVTRRSGNYCEVQAFSRDVHKFSPFEAVITLHEDSDRDKFYMYGLGAKNKDFYQAICEYAKTWIPVWANAEIEGCCTDEHGLIMANARDHGYDGRLFVDGLTRVACTLETPGKLDIQFRVNLMTQLVLITTQMLNSRRWMKPLSSAARKKERTSPNTKP